MGLFDKFIESISDVVEQPVSDLKPRKRGRPRVSDEERSEARREGPRYGKAGRVRPSKRKKKNVGKYMLKRKRMRRSKKKHRENGYYKTFDVPYRKTYRWNWEILRRRIVKGWLREEYRDELPKPECIGVHDWQHMKKVSKNAYWNDHCPIWKLSLDDYREFWESRKPLKVIDTSENIIAWLDIAPDINYSVDRIRIVKPFELVGKRVLTLRKQDDKVIWEIDSLECLLNKNNQQVTEYISPKERLDG